MYHSARELIWDGCHNLRDLGGIRTLDGSVTRRRSIIRGDCPTGLDLSSSNESKGLSISGWRALRSYGVRTIVNLRETRCNYPLTEMSGITPIHIPLDDPGDREFWQSCRDRRITSSPFYYREFVERKFDRCAAVLEAIVKAPDGGLLIHCRLGRDRTGLISLLLLNLANVGREAIISDYLDSATSLEPHLVHQGLSSNNGDQLCGSPRSIDASAENVLDVMLQDLDVAGRLLRAGFTTCQVNALRARIVRSV